MHSRAAVALLVLAFGALGLVEPARSQTVEDSRQLPNPYRSSENWAQLPAGRAWGSVSSVAVDPDGRSVWVFERCGAFAPPTALRPGVPFACDGSDLDPILKFDETGRLVTRFGAGLFLFPHGLHVDPSGNLWATDGLGRDGKGHQVFKFSPDGRVLLRLGKAGQPGPADDQFNAPSAVQVAPDGSVFVADGHGGDTNSRVLKFDAAGRLIKTWGKKGSAPGEFDIPHALAMDTRGRLFVADRNNNRIQIFDQDGIFIDAWTQFSRPSGIYIDANDTLFTTDSESESVSKNHDGWKRGIRVGSAKDGTVTAFIPDPVEVARGTSAAEGITADAAGNIYGAEVGPKRLMRYVKP